MLAYNKTTLENLAIHEAVEEATDLNLLSIEKEMEIKAHYKVDLYSPNIFVRIGLGLLTIFIVLSSAGLIGLLINPNDPTFIFLLLAAASFAVLTYITRNKKHFNSGVDHVLMITTIVFLTAAIIKMLPSNFYEDRLMPLIICITSFWFFLRFADSIMAIISFVAAVRFLVYPGIYTGQMSQMLLPLTIMVFAGLVYFIINKIRAQSIRIFYSKGLYALQVLALLTIYLAGNYAAVQKFSQLLLHTSLPIFFTVFFWSFTLLVPLLYIGVGIKFRNLLFCRIGLICTAFSILTYQYYYSTLSTEAYMLIAGIIVIAITYFLIKYLHQPKGGFIFKNLNRRSKDEANLEGVIIAETFEHRPASPQQETTFGGGSFGAAGGGDRY